MAKRKKNSDKIKLLEKRIEALENDIKELLSRTSSMVAYGPCPGIPTRRKMIPDDFGVPSSLVKPVLDYKKSKKHGVTVIRK